MIKNSQCLSSRGLGRFGAVFALCAALAVPASAQDSNGDAEVSVSDYETYTLTVKETDLAKVLEMLAIQSKKNIITSKNVSATVTANLYDVTFDQALESILEVNGYKYEAKGNFIYVYTFEEWTAIKEAERTTETKIYDLEYLSAVDAAEFIAPTLSEKGQSAYRGEVERGFQPDIATGGEDSYAYEAKLVVNDYAEVHEEIERILEELDTPPSQVLVECTVLQSQLDEANAFGVDFSLIGSMDFTDLANPLSAVNALLAGDDSTVGFQPLDQQAQAVAQTVGNTSGPGGLKVGIIDDDIAVFLKLLDEVTDVTVLSRPKIMCLNRQRAEVLVGARVGYLSTTATETTTTQTVEFLDTGIHLVLRPFVSSSGMVRMELAPSVSEASLRTVTDSNGLLVTIPDELTNEITTNVRVRDGETLVLGGLFREETSIGRRQVPLLGDIPLIGIPFRGQDDVVEKDEIIFLITPNIIDDSMVCDASHAFGEYVETARVGARQGLLPFSRAKIVNNYNKDAAAAFARGDTDRALYYANNSLRLQPMQAEMVRFREEITGADENVHESSIMERVMHQESAQMMGANYSNVFRSGMFPTDMTFNAANNTDESVTEVPFDIFGAWSMFLTPSNSSSSESSSMSGADATVSVDPNADLE